MIFPILSSLLILIGIISYFNRKSRNTITREQDAFWERERAANATRRKSLDDLDYINIPLSSLPMTLRADDATIASCIETISDLSEAPIVNLTGLSNTDLKLKYGAPNIDLLSLYDQRYTLLASTLQKWAEALISLEETDAARSILEYAVSIGTDVSGTYKSLAAIYASTGETEAVKALIPKVEALNTPLKASVLNNLNGYLT